MSNKQTFAERCQIAEECLPDTPYRDMLTALHAEMFDALACRPRHHERKQISTQTEAMKLALEFIERVNKDGWILADFEPQMYATITALREALMSGTDGAALPRGEATLAPLQQEPINVMQAYAMAQVCLDLHDAIGCSWGDNVYLAIKQLKEQPAVQQEKNT